MRVEVHSAADFLMNLLRVRKVNSLSENQLLTFRGSLQEVMQKLYINHWYPKDPKKGSGYRCIRINGKMDPMIEQACSIAGLNSRQLHKMLPQELTLWIDPSEVAYRIGENGSICMLYARDNRGSPSSDDSTGSEGSEDYTIERSSFEITPDLNKLILDFFEKTNSTIITKPKVHHYNRNKFTNNHQQYNTYNQYNSSSNGQLSPPLSPQQHFNSVYQHNRYHHQFSSPKFANNDYLQYCNNWDYNQHKVRAQC